MNDRRSATSGRPVATTRPGGAATALVVALVALVALVAAPRRAVAHVIGLSTGEYTARGARLDAKLVFARAEIAALAPRLDEDGDGHVTAAEVSSASPRLRAKILDRILVTDAGRPCPARLLDAALTEQDGLAVTARWECPTGGAKSVELAVLDDLSRGHRHVARVVAGESTHDRVLHRDERSFGVEAGAAPAPRDLAPSADEPETTDPTSSLSLFVMGIEHILTGYDHLVFLLGLVLVRARLRALLAAVTAFTVAHSITLALASLGVWAPAPGIVEPAIALSIAYVGVENLFVKDASRRWRVTFPFGLVHGFGFAGALREVALPPAEVPAALLAFNLGVEVGQLAALAVALPVVVALREAPWFAARGGRVVSGAVALAGGVWFVARVL